MGPSPHGKRRGSGVRELFDLDPWRIVEGSEGERRGPTWWGNSGGDDDANLAFALTFSPSGHGHHSSDDLNKGTWQFATEILETNGDRKYRRLPPFKMKGLEWFNAGSMQGIA
ncbi:hypothetical protein ACJRO7_002552 [Eucalyptus globulus]|uniref:Uncharacterized protein n=1 Tax=Eucalyptus globulus TaxID=34317 RepID=A0ABD3LYJ0_EUCGL